MASIRYFGLDSGEKPAISISLDEQMKKEQVEELRKKVRKLNLHQGGMFELKVNGNNCSVACPTASILLYLLTHQTFPSRKKHFLMNQIIRLVMRRDEEESSSDAYSLAEDHYLQTIEPQMKKLLKEENKRLDVKRLDKVKADIDFESSRLNEIEKEVSPWEAVRDQTEVADDLEHERIYRIEDDMRPIDEEINNQPIAQNLGMLAELKQKWRTSKTLRVSVYIGAVLLVIIIVIVIVILAVTSNK